MNHVCTHCGALLVVGENVTQNDITCSRYICRDCQRDRCRKYRRTHSDHLREWRRKYRYHIGESHPMSENRKCSAFLGVHVAERVLSHVFKNVEKMPYGNHGYDFRCGQGYMVDIKSSCRNISKKEADRWAFRIKKNQIADFFLCLAFDNRNDLNPEHIWLIPAGDVNDCIGISISETTFPKWDLYKLDVGKVQTCCNAIRGHTR